MRSINPYVQNRKSSNKKDSYKPLKQTLAHKQRAFSTRLGDLNHYVRYKKGALLFRRAPNAVLVYWSNLTFFQTMR